MYKSQLDYAYCPFCARTLETKLEEERPLKYCRECNWTHYLKHDIAVAGVVVRFNPSSPLNFEVLMVQRNREPSIGKWSFPAGFVNFGEHPDNALTREVREETGLTVIRSNLIKEVVSNDDPRSPNQLSRFYKAAAKGELKNMDQGENTKVEWKIINKKAPLPEIAWPNHERLFEEIRENVVSFLGFSNYSLYWLSEVR